MAPRTHCENCGALLRIPDEAKRVRCNHCGSQLAVRRHGGATITRRLRRIAARADSAAARLTEYRRVQRALESVEAEWDQELQERGWPKGGPRRRERLIPALMITLFAALFLGGLATGGYDAIRSGHADALFFLVPMMIPVVVFCALALAGMYYGWRKERSDIQQYQAARERYLERRGQLLEQSHVPGIGRD